MTPDAIRPVPMRCTRLDDQGLTLVEMLIAIVVAGLFGTAMYQLLLDQNQFYTEADDRLYAKQTLRSTSDLVESEIRSARGGDIHAAQPDSVALWYDEINAYVCNVTTSDVIHFYVYHRTVDPDLLGLLGDRGTAYLNPFTTNHQYDPGFDATGSQSSTAKSTCEAAGAPTGAADSEYRSVTWGGSLSPPQQGAVLRLYRQLSYHFAESELGDGLALWRNDQELASPFGGENLGFRYYVCSGGSCDWFTSVSDKSDQRNITRVELNARALGDGSNRHDVALSLDYDISLRN